MIVPLKLPSSLNFSVGFLVQGGDASPHTHVCSWGSQGRWVNGGIHSLPASFSAQTSRRADASPTLNALDINPWALQGSQHVETHPPLVLWAFTR